MRISAQTLAIIDTLRDLISQEEGNHANLLTVEISKLPDFADATATAGYYVTPEGDIVDDHWWLVMDDGSVFDANQDKPIRCSKKDPRFKHYVPYPGDKGLPVEVLTLADHIKGAKRTAHNRTFSEMVSERQTAYVQPEGVSDEELRAVERYADALFRKVGMDVAFSRHFLDRVNDPRNRPNINAAELVRLFKQTYKKHGKRIPRLGPDAEGVLRDMATDVNMPFVLQWDSRTGMLDLLSKTVMRKKNFGTSDPVFAVEDGKVVPSDAAQQASSMPGDMTAGGMPGVPDEEDDDEVRPEDMQLSWEDLLDEQEGASDSFGDAIARYQWMRNKEGGQEYGNQEVIVPMTPQRMAEYGVNIDYRPGLAMRLIRHNASGRWKLFKVDSLDNIPDPREIHPRWVIEVDSFDSPEAIEHGSTSDSDIKEVDHPEFMPGGEEDSGYDPTYDERRTQQNPGHPRP